MNHRHTKSRLVSIMALKALLLCAGLAMVSEVAFAGQVTASVFNNSPNDQKRNVTVAFENEPLADALHILARKVKVGISYNTKTMPEKLVTYQTKNASVYNVLDAILKGTGLQAKLSKDRKIILIKKKPVMSTVQQETITGTVTDASSGETLPGVNILVKGTTAGTSTDANGEFKLTVESLQDTLVFSFIGYQSQELSLKGGTTIDVALSSTTSSLEELVVTGLASTTKRKNLANAVTKIDSKELTETTPPTTVTEALSGKLPGVNIKSTGGAPGGGFNVQMRGISTIGAGNSQPLFVIDGVYANNSSVPSGRSEISGAGGSSQDVSGNRLADLDPDDIESIEVLKGPSAAAIYGQRANAGVVVITTKRGAAGQSKVSITQNIGFTSPLKLLGVASWDEEKIMNFYSGDRIDQEINRYREAMSAGKIYNYEKMLFDNKRPISKTDVSISGGNSKTQFYISGGYDFDNGLMKNTNFKRSSFRVNVDHNLSDKIKVSTSSYFAKSDNNRGFSGNQNVTGASVPYAVDFTPTYAQLLPSDDGTYPSNPYFSSNPLALVNLAKNNQNVTRAVQSVNLNVDLYDKKGSLVSFIANGGVDYLDTRSKQYFPNLLQSQQTSANPGDVIQSKQDNLNINLRGILKYLQEINKFSFVTQVGFTRFSEVQNFQQVRGSGLVPGEENIKQAKVQSVVNLTEQKITNIGWFAQEEINWDDKLIGTAGLRIDRSSLNYSQNHYYLFPKASLAANLTNFDFFDVDKIDQFKLRVAYGETGGTANYGAIYRALNSTNTGGLLGLTVSSRDIDPMLKPESGDEIEFGADISFLSNRVNLTATRYIKTIHDLILDRPSPRSTGITAVATNAGTLENKGIELGLNVIPIQKSKFSWTSDISFWKNKSKVTKLNIPAYTTGGYGTTLGNYLIQEGFSPTTIVGTPATPGQKSLYTIYGDAQPDFQMSFNQSFSFLNNFQFNFLFHWSRGNYNVNLVPYHQDKAGTTPDYNTPEGERRRNYTYFAEEYVDDASYLKLQQVGLHYTVPSTFLNNILASSLRSIRLGISASNVYIFSDYPGRVVSGSSFGAQAVNQSISNQPYPEARKVLFSIQVNI